MLRPAAVMISDVPWDGPIGAVRIGLIGGDFIIKPNYTQLEELVLDLPFAGTKDAVLMVEAGANEVSEERWLEALQLAHDAMQP